MPHTPLRSDAIDSIVAGQHGDPFAVLGPHPGRDGKASVRAFLPGARSVAVVLPDGTATALRARNSGGFWEGVVPGAGPPLAYRLRVVDEHGHTAEVEDPYRFPPTLTSYDLHLLGEGTHYRLFERLGAHPIRHEGVDGVRFAVWAPNARRVSVVGDWNGWDGRADPLHPVGSSGIWAAFVREIGAGHRYKYAIEGADGRLRLKADPMARYAEVPPANASIVLSIRSWRTIRARPAPIASRTAISCCRTRARARSRLATLAQAMRSTSATPAMRTRSGWR